MALVLSWVVGGKGDPEGSIYPPPDAITECGTVKDEFFSGLNYTDYYQVKITLNEEWRDGTEVAMMGLGALTNAIFVFIVVGPEVQAQLLGVLRALGLRDSVYWLSWYSIFGLVSVLSSLLGAVTAKLLTGHVYESVYFFGFLASLLFLNLAVVSASLFLVAVCGIRGNCCANMCILVMILAAFMPLIVQLSSSSLPYASYSQVTGFPTGLFWQNSATYTTYESTASAWNDTVGDDFTATELTTCEVPIMNQYQGNFLKTVNETKDVTNDEFFVGCFMQSSWPFQVWKENKVAERLFMFFFPYFHFMNIWGSFVGYTSMPNRQFTFKEASLSQEELAIAALPRPPSPNSATTMAPQGSMFVTKINYEYYYESGTTTCSVGDASDINMCSYVSACPYAEDPGAQYNAPTVLDSIGFLFALSVMYLIMAAYWSSVFDKGNGKRERFYFFLLPSYWFPVMSESRDQSDTGVVVEELTKTYGSVEALKEVSFKMNPGEVTALLGHNGAGKTTLTSILCCDAGGTKGDIRVFGHSVMTDSFFVRQMVGLCKQDDYLWPNLSAKEHLELFAALRGVGRVDLGDTVQKWLQSVDLDAVQLQYAGAYSGGMKRRLSVALATIGDRPLIVLDEPTTGMDPVSRRFVWKHIDEIKEGRVILLTTHAMEEADLLADEVAIMREGELAAFGSPLQLKTEHGTALQFTLLVDKTCLEEAQTLVERFFVDCDEWVEIQSSDTGTMLVKITSLLDHGDRHNIRIEKLASFLAWLDEEGSVVSEYGFSNSSLEEVFLKVTQGDRGATPFVSEAAMDVADEDVEMTGDGLNSHDLNLYTPKLSARNQAIVVFVTSVARSWRGRGSVGNYCLFGLLFLSTVVLFVGFSWTGDTYLLLTVANIMLSVLLLVIIGPIYTDRKEGQLYLMKAQGLLPLGFLCGLGLYAFTVQLVYNVLMLTGLFATPFFRESELCGIDGDWSSCYPGFGGRQYVNRVEIWNYSDEYEGKNVSLFAVRAPGGYGMVFGVAVVTAFATVGRTFATAFLPGYHIPLATIMLITLLVGCLPILLGIVKQSNDDDYEHCLNITNPNFFCDGNFSKSDVSADFVDCVGFMVDSVGLGTFCVSPQAALLPQVGMYQMLAMTYSSKVTFMSEPEEYVQNVLIPLLDAVQCKDDTCDFPFANRLYGLNFIYTFLGGVLLIVFGLLLAYTLVFPVGPIIHLKHMIKNSFDWSKSSQRTNNVDTQNEDSELPEVTEERESVAKIVGPFLADDAEPGSQSLDYSRIPRDEVAPAILHQIRKVYPALGGRPPKVAVERLDLHVPKGQVLGLLGKNGAGKTTALNILAGAHDATSGLALVAGYDCEAEKIKVFERLGNCAQFDVVWRSQSVQQHLEFFAALKGLPRQEIPKIARAVASAVGLGSEGVYHRKAGLLSGGMRRRLSIGMSLIGAPRMLILDEPTTGLDPSTRSSIWSLINSFASNERSMIITTHMMIEADTLCDRIAIVADGKLVVIGTQQHLKDKFGDGYVLQLNLVHNSPDHLERAMTFVRTRLHPEARLTSRQVKTLHFNLPHDINLESLFKGLYSKERTTEGCINQFLLSQASLEDVFITLGDGRVPGS